MKQLTFILLLTTLLTKNTLHAQTRPQASQYMFNYASLNPAVTGLDDYGQVQGGVRRQWAGIDGAPESNWISGSMPLNRPAGNYGYDVENNEIFYQPGHGMGFNLYHDKAGPYTTVNLNLGYAYHVPLSNTLALSAGFSGGLQQTRYDVSKSIYPDQAYDPAVTAQASMLKKITPDLNAGLLLYARKFFTGISLLQIIPAKFIDAPQSQSKNRTQLLTAAGYVFDLDEDGTSLWLSGILKSDFVNPSRYDITARVRFQNIGWLAGSYRKEDAIVGSFGLNISPKLALGYSYDWGINNKIASYSKGSHELCIGYRFLQNNQRSTPKMGW